MNTLIGVAIGITSMAIIMGMCAAIGALVFYNVDNLISLYVGIAVGVMIVIGAVGYLA